MIHPKQSALSELKENNSIQIQSSMYPKESNDCYSILLCALLIFKLPAISITDRVACII